MPRLTYEERGKVLRVVPTDSMGRTPDLAEQMERNDPRPPRLDKETKIYQAFVADEYKVWPKVMYRLAVDENGIPNGDLVNPSYPMPYDLAVSLGIEKMGFTRINQTSQSQGHFLVRHPYKTMLIPKDWDWKHPVDIDIVECKRQEKALIDAGWVDHLSKIAELTKAEVVVDDDPFKPLPSMAKNSPKTPGSRSVKVEA